MKFRMRLGRTCDQGLRGRGEWLPVCGTGGAFPTASTASCLHKVPMAPSISRDCWIKGSLYWTGTSLTFRTDRLSFDTEALDDGISTIIPMPGYVTTVNDSVRRRAPSL